MAAKSPIFAPCNAQQESVAALNTTFLDALSQIELLFFGTQPLLHLIVIARSSGRNFAVWCGSSGRRS